MLQFAQKEQKTCRSCRTDAEGETDTLFGGSTIKPAESVAGRAFTHYMLLDNHNICSCVFLQLTSDINSPDYRCENSILTHVNDFRRREASVHLDLSLCI